MKNVIAIICEYNPFHNGHKFHIDTHRRELNADGVVCIMSGSFTQRGEPACLSKWARAEMAVKEGADLVLELPVCFSSQSAERFARGGVSLANSLGIVKYLSFGSECGSAKLLEKAALILNEAEKSETFKKYYSEGLSYPAARQKAVESLADDEVLNAIKSPNNILGIEYIAALRKLKSKIIPITVKREGAEHNSSVSSKNIASASKIREMIKNGEDVSPFVPNNALEILKREKENIVTDFSPLSTVLSYILLTKTPEELSNIADISEGLENRFIEVARKGFQISEIAEFVKTKRYTKSRIDRIITNILLGIKKDDDFSECKYIRVLALNEKGAKMLNEIKEKSTLPIVSKVAEASFSGEAEKMFSLDLLSTDIYALLTKNKISGQDFLNSPVFVK